MMEQYIVQHLASIDESLQRIADALEKMEGVASFEKDLVDKMMSIGGAEGDDDFDGDDESFDEWRY